MWIENLNSDMSMWIENLNSDMSMWIENVTSATLRRGLLFYLITPWDRQIKLHPAVIRNKYRLKDIKKFMKEHKFIIHIYI